ncbi:MAG: hypothetical protein IKW37_01465 [Bacteroidaceae bacterium]|nr:hypothetical protein [Bacteroidaceae bacterium]
MADNKKKAPMEGPNGVDRWTSNGYGLTVNGKTVEPPEDDKNPDIDEIEEE